MAVAKSPLSILLCAAATMSSVFGSGGRGGASTALLLPADPAGTASPCDENDITTSRRSSTPSAAAAMVTRRGVIHGERRNPLSDLGWGEARRAPTRDTSRPRVPVTTAGVAMLVGLSASAAFPGDGVKRSEAGMPPMPRDMGCRGSAMRPTAASWWPTVSSASTRSFDSAKRAVASFARSFVTIASTSGGTFAPGARSAIFGIGAVTCIPRSVTLLSCS